jgi:hypothetical protein
MTKQYISDIITTEEIQKWQSGDRILIHSQTGSGKSEFIKNNLYEYCKNHNKMILLLSNRNLLRDQNKIDIQGKESHINARNYQELESKVLGGLSTDELFKPYDYIVYDESHYMFSDSQFNRNTDLLIEPIKNTPKNKIFIFITATPDALIDYQPDYQYQYNLKHDYSYIQDIYFYNRSPVVEAIIQHIPEDEKMLYFGSNAQDTWELSTKFGDSSFICSDKNKLHNKSNLKTIEQITLDSMFSNRLLFATKLLDNGVNIKDHKVKHIIINMADPISFIQCLGRKRCLIEEDQITLYIKNYHKGNLYNTVKNYNELISIGRDYSQLSELEFKNKYRKENLNNLIDIDYQLNRAKYQHYITQKRLAEVMFLDPDEMGYKKYICKLLDYDINKIKFADQEFEKLTMNKFLAKLVDRKMYKDEQEQFKVDFFERVFSPKVTNYRHRGARTINSIMDEDSIPYLLSSKKEYKGEKRNQHYWIITAMEK